ncbi:MAG: STAS domain-containing protein [Candidatus Coproplasma sp.]
MKIQKSLEKRTLIVVLEGRLDTVAAPELERELGELDGVSDLIFDLNGLEYVSSAGLRVILKAQKIMNSKGAMKLINVNESVMDVFEITGFADILTIE